MLVFEYKLMAGPEIEMGPGGGTDCLPVLIINKLLKMQDARSHQNPGNAVSTHM
jgi:hypothetical protein